MPKTYTDDVAQTLPSSIDGPFQVVDPADHDSWIKIDPAGAQIATAGAARPTRRVVASFARTYSSVTQAVIGAVLPARSISTLANGGFYATPFPIPDDMDVAQPAHVRLLVVPLTSSTMTGGVVRYALASTHGKPGEAPTDGSITLDWGAPDSWSANDPRLILVDAGSGYTFAGGTFENGDHVGLRIARLGSATEDTFDKSVKIAEQVIFEYQARRY